MFKLKVIFLVMAIVNCSFAAKIVDTEKIENQETPEESAVKINWLPVWDAVEENNEFVLRNSEGECLSVPAQGKCEAPNGLGLQNLLQEVDKILPKQQIKTIVKSYAEDPEIKALKAFLKKAQTQEKITAIYNSKEYQIFKDYSCRILHIDLAKYAKLARTFINPLLSRSADAKGIQGLFKEIEAVMPHQQLRDLYESLLASDEELVKAVAHLKSKEYHQLLLNLKNNVEEYKELRQQLISLGVPLEEMSQLLTNAFGPLAVSDLYV